MEHQIDVKSNVYLEQFYEPKVTAYEFMKCFFAFLKKGAVDEIERDLVSFLRSQKEDIANNDVLEEINFRTNGVNYYSDDIEDALFNLQNGGLLGKMNPSFGIIIIKYNENEIDESINSISEQYRAVIEKIANTYIENL
ncbi:MAG: hypothetical protein NC428_05665 [Clostridium sp.]|nr:hypothetical protein [Clostridium sp.]